MPLEIETISCRMEIKTYGRTKFLHTLQGRLNCWPSNYTSESTSVGGREFVPRPHSDPISFASRTVPFYGQAVSGMCTFCLYGRTRTAGRARTAGMTAGPCAAYTAWYLSGALRAQIYTVPNFIGNCRRTIDFGVAR